MTKQELTEAVAALKDPGQPLSHALALRIADALEALSPPTTEDVARDYDNIRLTLHTCVAGTNPARWTAEDSAGRLRDGAARAQGLEAKMDALLAEHGITLSERDAARQAAELLKERYGGPRCKRQECTMERGEVDRLTDRVATLERDVESWRLAHSNAEAERAANDVRAEAAERRVAELEEQVRRGYGPTLKEVFGSLDGFLAHARSAARYHGNKELAKAALLDLVTKHVPESEMHHAVGRIELLSADGPAPAGLLEAVGPRITATERLVDVARRLAGGATNRVVWEALDCALAAYDTAKGGEATEPEWQRCPDCQLTWRPILVRMPDAANVVQDASATDAERARKWDAAVKRAKDVKALARVSWAAWRVHPGPSGFVEAEAIAVARYVLGLDTPPSGPGGGETATLDDSGPAHVCGEEGTECQKCQRPGLDPSVLESTHREPVVLGKGPFVMDPDIAARAVERTHRTVTDAQSAPEVVLDREGVRVEKWPGVEDYTIHISTKGSANALDVLARALAEAKREASAAVASKEAAGRILDASTRKAAEDMRERAALVAFDGTCATCHRAIVWDEHGGEAGTGAWNHVDPAYGCMADPNGSPLAAARIRALSVEAP
jgi:hypothetical protein